MNKLLKEETEINEELFRKHFHFQTLTAMFKNLYNQNKNKNNESVNVIKSGLIDLKKCRKMRLKMKNCIK